MAAIFYLLGLFVLLSLWLVLLLSYILLPLLAIVAVNKLLDRWKRKKKKSIKQWDYVSFETFAGHCEKGLLYWEKEQDAFYRAEWNGWSMTVEMTDHVHHFQVNYDGRSVLHGSFYPKSRTYGHITREPAIERMMKQTIGSKETEESFARILAMMMQPNWTERVTVKPDEETMMRETNQAIQSRRSEALIATYKRFQHYYVESIRYELHMDEREKKAWKQSLHLMHALQAQDEHQPIELRDMYHVVEALAEGVQTLFFRMKAKYGHEKTTHLRKKEPGDTLKTTPE